jgi:AcrR family transcriptional regulator
MDRPSPHAGRPRDTRLNDALLKAALEVFLERGYHGATVAEIARRAGVGTPALYRRWPNKADLAIDIVLMQSRPDPIPDTGSIGDDLAEFVRIRLESWGKPLFHQIVLPLILEAVSDSRLAYKVSATFLNYREALAERIGRSIAAGELREDTDPHRLLDVLMGTIAMPLLFSVELPPVSDARIIVEQVLDGFAGKGRSARQPDTAG